jgi:nucleoid-associated protein YgaU
VYIRTVEATAAGQLLVKGSAEANAVVRLYLNGAFVADASAGPDRQWSLTIEHGMAPGLYTIRADEIDRANGAVSARAEVPFSYPQNPSATAGSLAAAAPLAQTASAAPSTPPTPAATPSPAPAVAPAAAQSAATSTSAPNPTAPKPSAAATPAPPASSAQAPSPSPSATPPTDVVVADVRTTTVVRGDNLWDLARRFYGDGTRFRQIFAANASQIRDPSLIYIGQIFVVPKAPPP